MNFMLMLILSILFAALCFVIVYQGVEEGIEKYSKILMPILLIIVVFIAIYSLFIKHTDVNGVTRTGLQGAAVYFIPNFEGVTFKKFLTIVLDAMGQLFYSLSIAMGIMITYGSYIKKNANLVKSVNQIELFDTGIALLAGMMIIPAVYVFSGTEGMSATTFVISILVCLGYNVFYFELKFPNNTIKKGSQYNGCPFFCESKRAK